MRRWLYPAACIAFVIVVALLALSLRTEGYTPAPTPAHPYVADLRRQEGGAPLTTTVPAYEPSAAPEAARSVSPSSSPRPTPGLRATSKPRFIVGVATYYTAQPGFFGAAGPALRRALGSSWRGQTVMVCGFTGGVSRCRPVLLSDWCACGLGHVIDLTTEAWQAVCGLPLSAGVCRVEVQL